jgi:hypothetical protein
LAGLVQKLTASLGGTARFWRARRYVRARWFYAMRWLFGRRHVASETRAYITAARYLARRSALSIVLAASLVLALHFAERSWTALVCDVGLGGTAIGRAITRPVDRGTYAILLQSVAAVTGVFLALYFAAVSTVAATVYSEVPHDIRDLMLRDKLGNFYVRAVAFLSALAIFLLVEQASGGAAYHLALPIVALLAGFAVFAFISLGQRAFYFSDPTVLSQLVVGDFLRSFSDASAQGWRWTDPSFQEHYRSRARRGVTSLNALLQFSRTHDFVRDDSGQSVVLWFVNLLRVYLVRKTTVPTQSRWFGETYEQRQWYLTESSALELASETASPLTPTTVPDVDWVEKALLRPVLTAIGEDLRVGRGQPAYVVLAGLSDVFEQFGARLTAEAGLEWVMTATEHVINGVTHAVEQSLDAEQLVALVASIDMLANLPVSIEVGLYRRLFDLDVEGLIAKLKSADWASDTSPYGLGLPRAVVETLEELRSGIDFEAQADSKVRTPAWYVAEIARNRLAWCVHDDFEACFSKIETWYPETADRLLSANLPQAAGAVLARGLELAWKLERHLESLPGIVDQLGAVGALDDLRRPEWDWPGLDGRAKAFRGQILRRMAAAIPALAEQPSTKELPDYLGQAVHWSGDGAFRALVDNDEGLFRDLFPAYFVGALHIVERLRPEVSAWTSTNSAVTWMSEPIMDLIDISGYAMIYSEYHANQALWTICQTPWDAYLSRTNANELITFLAAVCGHHQRLFAISPRSILRTRREMITTQLLGELPRQPPQTLFDEPAVVHASALIRLVAPRGFYPMPYYDARDVFIVRYLMALGPAAGLDFGITDDKAESLSELDDGTNGGGE